VEEPAALQGVDLRTTPTRGLGRFPHCWHRKEGSGPRRTPSGSGCTCSQGDSTSATPGNPADSPHPPPAPCAVISAHTSARPYDSPGPTMLMAGRSNLIEVRPGEPASKASLRSSRECSAMRRWSPPGEVNATRRAGSPASRGFPGRWRRPHAIPMFPHAVAPRPRCPTGEEKRRVIWGALRDRGSRPHVEEGGILILAASGAPLFSVGGIRHDPFIGRSVMAPSG